MTTLLGIPLYEIDLPTSGGTILPQFKAQGEHTWLGFHRKRQEWVALKKCKDVGLMIFEEPTDTDRINRERRVDMSLIGNFFSRLALANLDEHHNLAHSSFSFSPKQLASHPYFPQNQGRQMGVGSLNLTQP